MREPEPLVPKPRQDTGHLPAAAAAAADSVTGGQKRRIDGPLDLGGLARSLSLAARRCGRADSAG